MSEAGPSPSLGFLWAAVPAVGEPFPLLRVASWVHPVGQSFRRVGSLCRPTPGRGLLEQLMAHEKPQALHSCSAACCRCACGSALGAAWLRSQPCLPLCAWTGTPLGRSCALGDVELLGGLVGSAGEHCPAPRLLGRAPSECVWSPPSGVMPFPWKVPAGGQTSWAGADSCLFSHAAGTSPASARLAQTSALPRGTGSPLGHALCARFKAASSSAQY